MLNINKGKSNWRKREEIDNNNKTKKKTFFIYFVNLCITNADV